MSRAPGSDLPSSPATSPLQRGGGRGRGGRGRRRHTDDDDDDDDDDRARRPRVLDAAAAAGDDDDDGSAEAMEDDRVAESSESAASDEDSGEELVGDGMERDYQAMPELDTYDVSELDESEQGGMSMAQRRAAEAEMEERDAARRGRLPQALRDDVLRDYPGAKRVQVASRQPLRLCPLNDLTGLVSELLVTEAVRNEVKRRFRNFLTTYAESEGERIVYTARITRMCQDQGSSIEVDFMHLAKAESTLAMWLCDYPRMMLDILDEVLMDVVLTLFPSYKGIQESVNVRISNLPVVDALRELRTPHLHRLVRTVGVVIRRTSIFPQLKHVWYLCAKCGQSLGPFVQNAYQTIQIGQCAQCQSKGPFTINEERTVYGNYQKIALQESPGEVLGGRLPRSKDIVLTGDLIDSARPGESVSITGIYVDSYDARLNNTQSFPVFQTLIEAVHISKRDEHSAAMQWTEDDKARFSQLSRDPDIASKIAASIAPSIFGHRNVKQAIALMLFGGQAKDAGRHRIRGDLNVLLIGDPGTAKSQFLNDAVTREFTLEGGALVLADHGVCLIDEFDKMNDQDRTSIHEAMEQQSISISKAGIVTTLQARCAVLAAANPLKGRYDGQLSLSENVDLSEPLLSRFDVICIIRDTIEPIVDEELARFVVGSHQKSHPDNAAQTVQTIETPVDQDILKKYIAYARMHCFPRLNQLDQDKLTKLYATLRKRISEIGGGVQASVRHIESIIRMSEAHARMHLRDFVLDSDVNMAISVMLNTFIDQQKSAVKSTLRKDFVQYLSFGRDNDDLLLHVLESLVKQEIARVRNRVALTKQPMPTDISVRMADFEARARELGIDSTAQFLKSDILQRHGFSHDRRNNVLRRQLQFGRGDDEGGTPASASASQSQQQASQGRPAPTRRRRAAA